MDNQDTWVKKSNTFGIFGEDFGEGDVARVARDVPDLEAGLLIGGEFEVLLGEVAVDGWREERHVLVEDVFVEEGGFAGVGRAGQAELYVDRGV